MMYSDEDLTAFLDGELDTAKAAEISASLAEDAGLAARLSALDLDKTALGSAFAPLLLAAPAPILPPAQPRRALMALVASLMLALGIGIGGYLLAPQKGWEIEVAHYQALYVVETLNGIEPDTRRLAQEIANANALLDLELSQKTLAGFDGMTLRRAQVLGFEGQTLIQIAYTMADGTPVAFCILKRENANDQAVETTELIGLAAATWQSANHSFLTIGGKDQALMASFANHLAAAL